MKTLLICLLAGCLVSPAWGTEREMTIQEFVQKLEKAEPWTQEKVEAQLGVNLTYTTTTEVITRYTAYEPLPSVKNLAIQYISLSVSATTNKTLYLDVELDSNLSCLTLEQMKEFYPGGSVDASKINPGGGLYYFHKRSWGELEFNFDTWRKEKNCLVRISTITNNPLK